MPERDDPKAHFDPTFLTWTEDDENGCREHNDPHGSDCWMCNGFDFNNAPPRHIGPYFCCDGCERGWRTTQPLQNLLFKRAFKKKGAV